MFNLPEAGSVPAVPSRSTPGSRAGWLAGRLPMTGARVSAAQPGRSPYGRLQNCELRWVYFCKFGGATHGLYDLQAIVPVPHIPAERSL